MNNPNILIGIGQDSHLFDIEDSNKRLMLGGFLIDDHIGLKGNSDADVVLHSLFNAISSALGEKSLGHYSDPMCLKHGITDSREYLKVILSIMNKRGYFLSNISISLECKTPKIEKTSFNIKKSLHQSTNVPMENIGITATSGEEMTSFGKGEGIQCFSNVLLQKKPTPIYKKPIFILTITVIIAYFLILYYTFNNLDLI